MYTREINIFKNNIDFYNLEFREILNKKVKLPISKKSYSNSLFVIEQKTRNKHKIFTFYLRDNKRASEPCLLTGELNNIQLDIKEEEYINKELFSVNWTFNITSIEKYLLSVLWYNADNLPRYFNHSELFNVIMNISKVLDDSIKESKSINIKSLDLELNSLVSKEVCTFAEERPYKIKIFTKNVVRYEYNKNYGDERKCKCGHEYYRHFDTYDKMFPCGCKYCECSKFIEKRN